MQIFAPFTPEQVEGLNRYQVSGIFHEFTCGNDSNHQALVATADGWVCPDCDYTQNWAHHFMVVSEEFIKEMTCSTQPPWPV